MRYLFSLLMFMSSLFISSSIFAQEIPNADMEKWIKYGTYEDPQYWKTPNQATSPLFVFSVTKESTDVYAGSYAARLESMSILGGMAIVPGFMTIGDFDVNTSTMEYSIYGGVSFTNRPLRLKGYHKYIPQDGDQWLIAINTFKYDSVNDKLDTIGIGFFEGGATDSIWTPFEVFINYWSQDDPDSLNIIILSSSNETPPAGSLLLIDSMWFDYTPSSLAEDRNEVQFDVYPNPATNQVTIRLNHETEAFISLTNLWGQDVFKQIIKDKTTSIDLSHLPKGIYLVKSNTKDANYIKKLILR